MEFDEFQGQRIARLSEFSSRRQLLVRPRAASRSHEEGNTGLLGCYPSTRTTCHPAARPFIAFPRQRSPGALT